MNKIVNYLLDYLKTTFHAGLFFTIALLIGVGIYFRYFLEVDTYFIGQAYRPLKGLLFYSIPYFGTILLIVSFKKNWQIFRKWQFWLLSASLLFVLVLNQYYLLYECLLGEFSRELYPFLSNLFYNLFTALVYLSVPLAYFIFTRPNYFYGFTLKGFQYRPYLWMLLLMLPLLIWASFQPSFLAMYPRYKPSTAETYLNVSPYLTIGSYELSYALQFIFLELFFRGFMIMKLEKYLGALAVLPMVSVYAFIHFGKPMPETLGSVFGGFILGVLALKSRSVFGGICIHIGIALLMELLAYFQLSAWT